MWDFSYCGIHNPQCVVKVSVFLSWKFSISNSLELYSVFTVINGSVILVEIHLLRIS